VGIDLSEVVARRNVGLSEYSGRRVAIDAWNILYQFLSSIRQPDGTPLSDNDGNITSHLAGTLYRTAALVEAGIKPIFVFDGEPHPLKRETLAARAARKEQAAKELEQARPLVATAQEAVASAQTEDERLEALANLKASEAKAKTKAQQTSRLTAPMVEEAQALLRALGIPVVQAPGEGEAQAAWMCQAGLVHAAVSQDFDGLLFGAPLLVRNLTVTGRRKLPGKQVWVDVEPEEVPLQGTLSALNLTREQLVDVALLVGTDFHPGVKGLGAKKAIPLIQKDGSLDALLARLTTGGAKSAAERAVLEQQESLAERDVVRGIFLDPAHADPGPLELRPPDADVVRSLMVDQHGFSRERVETAVARFQAGRSKQAQTRLF
jgi:flap endonuclease-1